MIYQICKGASTTNTLLVTYAYTMRTFYFYSLVAFGMNYGTQISTEVNQKTSFLSKKKTFYISPFIVVQAKYTNQILSKALNLPLSISVLNQVNWTSQLSFKLTFYYFLFRLQLEHFLQQISHSFTTVSCGLFSLDWTLFYTVFMARIMQFDLWFYIILISDVCGCSFISSSVHSIRYSSHGNQ